jgi:hypothetical protein
MASLLWHLAHPSQPLQLFGCATGPDAYVVHPTTNKFPRFRRWTSSETSPCSLCPRLSLTPLPVLPPCPTSAPGSRSVVLLWKNCPMQA